MAWLGVPFKAQSPLGPGQYPGIPSTTQMLSLPVELWLQQLWLPADQDSWVVVTVVALLLVTAVLVLMVIVIKMYWTDAKLEAPSFLQPWLKAKPVGAEGPVSSRPNSKDSRVTRRALDQSSRYADLSLDEATLIKNGKHVLVAYIMKPKAGYDYLATAAHFAAESSTGTNVNVCTTDDFT
ncbi:rbcL, partial [Symbiodinium microadriaticum]